MLYCNDKRPHCNTWIVCLVYWCKRELGVSRGLSAVDPMVQIAVDNSRHVLYVRSEKGTIFMYDLGQDGKGFSKVAAIPLDTIVREDSHIAKTIDKPNFRHLVHIAPVTKSESNNIHLVAITQTGVRLYFATNQFGTLTARPNMLTLVHVRLPPGFITSSAPQRVNNVHMTFYKQGCMLLLSGQGENSDLLWTVSSDSFPFQNQLMESLTTVGVDGKSWACCEVEYARPENPQSILTGGRDPPVVVIQHARPPRKFVILSAQGSHIFSKMRPVDQLRQLLIDCQGPDADEVKAFFRLHKLKQACATCLILACTRLATDQQVADWTKMVFFLYGGEAQYTYNGAMMGDRPMMPSNIGPAGGGFGGNSTLLYSPDGRPQQNITSFPSPQPGMHPSRTSTPMPYGHQTMYHPGFMQDMSFSGKHNGICLYLSRILRPISEVMVTKEFPCQIPEGTVSYVGITLSHTNGTPFDRHSSGDVEAAERYNQFGLGWFANPIFGNGDYPDVMKWQVGNKSVEDGLKESRLPEFTEEEKLMLKGSGDFLGYNMYTSRKIKAGLNPLGHSTYDTDTDLQDVQYPTWAKSGSSWLRVTSWGIRQGLSWIKGHYDNIPVYVTENGVSDNTDIDLDGCDVKGYTAWSFMDNFEWIRGYSEHFGLRSVNFSDPERPRTPKASAKIFTSVIENNGFLRSGKIPPPTSVPPMQTTAQIIQIDTKHKHKTGSSAKPTLSVSSPFLFGIQFSMIQ